METETEAESSADADVDENYPGATAYDVPEAPEFSSEVAALRTGRGEPAGSYASDYTTTRTRSKSR